MAKYKIKHITDYYYDSPVFDSINQVMLYPIEDERQKVKSHSIGITQNPLISKFNDKFGNELAIFSLLAPHTQLNITNIIEVELLPLNEPFIEKSIPEQWKEEHELETNYKVNEFLYIEPIKALQKIKDLTFSLINYEISPLDNAKNLSNYIYENFQYRQGVTSVETEIDDIWELKAGVCQDFAHFLLVMLRIAKIPARYVSGYICPHNHELRGEGATHAWVEIYLPDFGWIGLDPTNNCLASDRHVRLAVGRDFKDCTPVKGIFKGNINHRLEVSVFVDNLDKIENTHDHYPANYYSQSEKSEPSFVSVSKQENTADNSYLAHQQLQRQIQMQQQQ